MLTQERGCRLTAVLLLNDREKNILPFPSFSKVPDPELAEVNREFFCGLQQMLDHNIPGNWSTSLIYQLLSYDR